MSFDNLDPEQVRSRFGELVHLQTRTYREFDDPSGGIWKPEFFEGALVRYRLHSAPKAVKATRWKRR